MVSLSILFGPWRICCISVCLLGREVGKISCLWWSLLTTTFNWLVFIWLRMKCCMDTGVFLHFVGMWLVRAPYLVLFKYDRLMIKYVKFDKTC
jgi:hypothetical protein